MVQPYILAVDDEPFDLKLISHQLVNLGMGQVETCTSCAAALILLQEHGASEQLIFLDLNMPGMDGVEFIRRLATLHYRGGLVLVSGEDERVWKRRCAWRVTMRLTYWAI